VLYDNKSRAISWGSKIINRDSLTPSNLKYCRDGMAQKNKLKYKDDIVNSEAIITVNDETLTRNVDFLLRCHTQQAARCLPVLE
jgi:exo-beta-1,3-glucanase (GH17 family)